MGELITIGWSPIMERIDVKFENAARMVAKRLRDFECDPYDKANQFRLFSALRRAKFFYVGICRKYGSGYNGGAQEFYAVVDEVFDLLSHQKVSTNVLRGIRRQISEIRQAREKCIVT
ncbi:hypothetical protein KA005_16135 [bacterium]|nr:hypothetical protein [bacterium]